jgi:uncharacterized protein YbjT (DUF2867 family)
LLAQHQIHAIEAAERAGVQRIVKLSGSKWTLPPAGSTLSGDLHHAAEQRLAESPIAHVILQPNAWMQVALGQLGAKLAQEDILTDPFSGAAVAYIDARDIAHVAVAALLETARQAPPAGQAWVLTGPQALTFEALAACAAQARGRPIGVRRVAHGSSAIAAPVGAEQPFLTTVHAQFAERIRAGAASEVTETVAAVLGRPARTAANFLREQLPLNVLST